jgi:molybdate transport system substrate-binding protein
MKSISRPALRTAFVMGLLVLVMESSAPAAEITLQCAAAVESWMNEMIPEFQKISSHNVKPTFDIINLITERVRKGDPIDLAIVSPQQWESLHNEGKLDPATRVVIAKVAYGVFVRKGAAKPDISSVEAVKRAFLNARSIAVFNPAGRGPTTIYQARVFELLGISADIRPKLKIAGAPKPNQVVSAPLFELVANGDAEISVAMISDIVQAPGVALVGLVPAEIQEFTSYMTVIPVHAKEPTAARVFIEFLTSPRATSILKLKGLEPG